MRRVQVLRPGLVKIIALGNPSDYLQHGFVDLHKKRRGLIAREGSVGRIEFHENDCRTDAQHSALAVQRPDAYYMRSIIMRIMDSIISMRFSII